MNIDIKRISPLRKEHVEGLGFNGYRTNKIYEVIKLSSNDSVGMSIELKKLETTYIKEWETKDTSISFFNEIISEGYSYGAYFDNELVGFILLSYIKWNNTLWIENIRVKKSIQGYGLGASLLNQGVNIAKGIGARLIGLETQSSNYPAIQFYRKFGFEITGIDLERYPQRPKDIEQVGILMSYKIK